MASVQITESLPHPPERVWRALTDPAELARWWAQGDIRALLGHRFTLDMGPPWGQQRCEVLAVQAQRLLSYSFAPSTLQTAVTWTLLADGQGTRLSLEHAGFDMASSEGQEAYQGMGARWPHVLARLEQMLAAHPG
jgi:uncharacterized protein YndB with AHSA1/START domain